MKKFLVLCFCLVMVSSFLTGCLSSNNNKQAGHVFPVGKGNPAIIVVDNQADKLVDFFVDGILLNSVNPRKVNSLRLSEKRGNFEFLVKFRDGRGDSRNLDLSPGKKISISVFEEDGDMVVSFSSRGRKFYGSSRSSGRLGNPNYYGGRNYTQPFAGDGMMRIHNSHLNDLIRQRERRNRY